MVCTLLDHRNEVKMFKTFQWNHSPAACGFTWVLNILTLFLWSILEYRGIENSWHFELLITSSHTMHTMNVNQLVESISHLQAWLDTNLLINPRTYMQILHTPHRGTSRGGGGCWRNPFEEFLICCGISNWFCLQCTVFDLPILSKRWGIFYGWWPCWRPVTSPTMVAILAAILDFTKN